jgi:hypothetical protein
MSRILRIPVLLPGAVLVVAAVALLPHALHRPQHQPGLVMIAATKGFGLTGVPVTKLYPGAVKSMTVQIKNPYTYTIKVKPLTATVSPATGKAGCVGGAANLKVNRASSKVIVVKAHETVKAVVKVMMPGTVANACQGAKFKINLRSSATKA